MIVMAPIPSIANKAPDFELPRTVDEKVKLSEQLHSGSAILLFYPLGWSPVSTKELCTLRDGFNECEELGVKVVAVSVDSIFSLRAWADRLGNTLLSDFNREVTKHYGVVHEEILGLKGSATRSVFILDEQATIRYRWVTDNPSQLPDVGEIKHTIKKLF